MSKPDIDWTEELFDAVFDNDLASVRNAVAKGADIMALYDQDQFDILTAAITSEADYELAKALIGFGANPNLLNADGVTPLYWAVFRDDTEMVELLIKAGARVDAEKPGDGHTSLHAASEQNHLENVKLLLKAGGESALNMFDYVSRTPLMCAVENRNVEIVKALIEAGSDVNAHDESRIGDNALLKATEMGDVAMAQLLIDANADPTIEGWMRNTALFGVQNPKTPEQQRILELFEKKAMSR